MTQKTNPTPVHVADLQPEKVKALRIADNQTATLAEWDMELLPLELASLRDSEYDLSFLGFDEEELAKILEKMVMATMSSNLWWQRPRTRGSGRSSK